MLWVGMRRGEVLQRKDQRGLQNRGRHKPVMNHPPNSFGKAERREIGAIFDGILT
jgi:hypothetical protein